jgi:hypothetical protein
MMETMKRPSLLAGVVLALFMPAAIAHASVDVVELPSGVGSTCCLANPAGVVEMMKAGVGIGLQRACEIFQVLARMFALAIR